MKFRWTIKELNEFTDEEVLRRLITERLSTLNPYAPLAVRLGKVYTKLGRQIKQTNYFTSAPKFARFSKKH